MRTRALHNWRAKLGVPGLALLLAAMPAISQESVPADGPPPLSLEPLIELAIAENPEIRELDRRVEAAEFVVPQAGSLADPRVGVALRSVPVGTLAFDMIPMTGMDLFAAQGIPYPGKLRLRKEVARRGAEAVEQLRLEKINEVVRRVKHAYLDLYFIDKSILITLENKRLLESFVEFAQVKYGVGKGVQQDEVRAQVRVSEIIDELLRLRQQQISAQAELNAVLNRPPDSPLGVPGDVVKHKLTISRAALEASAIQDRPALRHVERRVQQFEAATRLAERDLKPDFDFSVGYRVRARAPGDPTRGRDWWSASAAAILPIWAETKQEMRIEEMRANRRAAEAEYEALQTEILAKLKDLYARLERLDREIELFRTGLIPQAELSLASARGAYIALEKVDFLTLLDAQITLYKYQIAYYKAITEFEKALAELEYVIGQRLY
ncbi:MAG: TolC family protein [Armatimonadota bacterium]